MIWKQVLWKLLRTLGILCSELIFSLSLKIWMVNAFSARVFVFFSLNIFFRIKNDKFLICEDRCAFFVKNIQVILVLYFFRKISFCFKFQCKMIDNFLCQFGVMCQHLTVFIWLQVGDFLIFFYEINSHLQCTLCGWGWWLVRKWKNTLVGIQLKWKW